MQYCPVMPVNLAPIRHHSGFNGMEIDGAQAFPAEQIIQERCNKRTDGA